MTEPNAVRDGDGSQWLRQSDGTYRLRSRDRWSALFQGYTLARIADEFGIIGKTFDDNGTDRDYNYLRSK